MEDNRISPNDRPTDKNAAANASETSAPPLDPNDEVPVPIAMSPAEVDERAQVVEALREGSNSNQADELGLQP